MSTNFIIRSSSARIGDRGYFNNLARLSNDEVGTHLYNWLLRYDITIDLRSIPNTKMRTQLKMNSVPEPIHWFIQVLRGEIGNIVCGEFYQGSILFRSFNEWAINGNYKHTFVDRTFLQSISKVVKSKVERREGKAVRGYIFNQEECLVALKEYLNLPDLNLDEI